MWNLLRQLFVAKPKCACFGCYNAATETPNSPYMNEYCDGCTYERHDIGGHK
jgi:hypothetical protein